jgi:hypothetical protein
LHARRIVLPAKDADPVVFAPEGLEALKCLLAIMKTGSCHMDADVFRGAHLQLAPGSIPIVTTDIIIGFIVPERKAAPFNIFHNTLLFMVVTFLVRLAKI